MALITFLFKVLFFHFQAASPWPRGISLQDHCPQGPRLMCGPWEVACHAVLSAWQPPHISFPSISNYSVLYIVLFVYFISVMFYCDNSMLPCYSWCLEVIVFFKLRDLFLWRLEGYVYFIIFFVTINSKYEVCFIWSSTTQSLEKEASIHDMQFLPSGIWPSRWREDMSVDEKKIIIMTVFELWITMFWCCLKNFS